MNSSVTDRPWPSNECETVLAAENKEISSSKRVRDSRSSAVEQKMQGAYSQHCSRPGGGGGQPGWIYEIIGGRGQSRAGILREEGGQGSNSSGGGGGGRAGSSKRQVRSARANLGCPPLTPSWNPLCLCHFIPSFWNNSATVREGVTKFEMPRQKLLKKCLFLFIAPFDLWPLPWHECANLCCDHDNWRKIAWIAPKFACRLSFTQGSDKFENQFGRTSTFKMAADLKKMARAIFFKMP